MDNRRLNSFSVSLCKEEIEGELDVPSKFMKRLLSSILKTVPLRKSSYREYVKRDCMKGAKAYERWCVNHRSI
jgi:hypothetical protein